MLAKDAHADGGAADVCAERGELDDVIARHGTEHERKLRASALVGDDVLGGVHGARCGLRQGRCGQADAGDRHLVRVADGEADEKRVAGLAHPERLTGKRRRDVHHQLGGGCEREGEAGQPDDQKGPGPARTRMIPHEPLPRTPGHALPPRQRLSTE